MKNFWYSTSTLIGMMVGVGMFALPYAFYKAGFFVGSIYFVLMFLVFLILHLMMGEVVLRTEEEHRFIGYCGVYLGKTMRKVASFTNLFSIFGSLLAYIIIAGSFIHIISGSLFFSFNMGQLFFWFIMTIILLFGVLRMERTEFIMLIFLILMVIFMFFNGVKSIEFINFFTFESSNIFLPYGILIYSFAGISAIPIMRDALRGKEKMLKRSIITGLSIAAFIYFTFIFLGVGVSGSFVSEDALLGMSQFLGDKIIFLGALFGLFAISTSYMAYSFYLKQTLIYDLKINKNISLIIVSFVPIILFFISSASFIDLIVLLGAVFGGVEGIMLVKIYKKVKQKGNRDPEYSLKISNIVLYLIMLMFVIGIFYEMFYNL
jgi:amino acid permease